MSDIVEVIAAEIDPEAWTPGWMWPPRAVRKATARRRAKAVLAALEKGGWVVAPRVPTEAIIAALTEGDPWDDPDLMERVERDNDSMTKAASDRPKSPGITHLQEVFRGEKD